MTNAEQAFEAELEVFRIEAETAAQFFYSYTGMREVATKRPRLFDTLNENPLFWTTVLGGLQTAALIAVGRIFDQTSSHNLDALLRMAQRTPAIFSKQSLGARKQGTARVAPAWLAGYLRSAYEPSADDFRRLRRHANNYRRVYDTKYRALRNKYFAHMEGADPRALFEKTNMREMQRIFVFLLRLHRALQQLFANGRKPVLRPLRYSVARITKRLSKTVPDDSVHERIVREAERVLLGIQAASGRRKTPP